VAEVIIVVAILIAVAIGEILNRWWARSHPTDGLSVGDLVNPIATVAAILLAFVMVEALGSFDRARQTSTEEAAAVDREAKSAERIADAELAREFETTLVCYVRAVRYLEWPDMATGGDPYPGVDAWSIELAGIIHEIKDWGGDPEELDRLVDGLETARGIFGG
jgi:hypothetical protein